MIKPIIGNKTCQMTLTQLGFETQEGKKDTKPTIWGFIFKDKSLPIRRSKIAKSNDFILKVFQFSQVLSSARSRIDWIREEIVVVKTKERNISYFGSSSVTRFGEISPLCQKFTSLWQNFESSFHIWQDGEPILANLWHNWANFHVANGQILKNNLTIWSHW